MIIFKRYCKKCNIELTFDNPKNENCSKCGGFADLLSEEKYVWRGRYKGEEAETARERIRLKIEDCFVAIEKDETIFGEKRLIKEQIIAKKKFDEYTKDIQRNINLLLFWHECPKHGFECFSEDLLLEVIAWLKGKSDKIKRLYKDCTELGLAFKVFQTFVVQEAVQYKTSFAFREAHASLKLVIRKDADYGDDNKVTYENSIQYAQTYFHGRAPDISDNPEKIYIGRETREEIIVHPERDLQGEAMREALQLWELKIKLLERRSPKFWAFLKVEQVESELWDYFSIMDEKSFIHLTKQKAGIRPFPAEEDIDVNWHFRKLYKLLQANQSHESVKAYRKLHAEDREIQDHAFEYLSKPIWERQGYLKFQVRRGIESSGKYSILRFLKELQDKGIYKKGYDTFNKQYKDYVKRERMTYESKIINAEGEECEKIENLATIYPEYDESVKGRIKIKVKVKPGYEYHPSNMDNVKIKCITIIFHKILSEKVAERRQEIDEEKLIATKGKFETYCEEIESVKEEKLLEYNVENEIPFLFPHVRKTLAGLEKKKVDGQTKIKQVVKGPEFYRITENAFESEINAAAV